MDGYKIQNCLQVFNATFVNFVVIYCTYTYKKKKKAKKKQIQQSSIKIKVKQVQFNTGIMKKAVKKFFKH